MEHKTLYTAIKNLYTVEPYIPQHDIALALTDMGIPAVSGTQWTANRVSIFMVQHGCPRRVAEMHYTKYRPQISCRQCIEAGKLYNTKALALWITWAIEKGRVKPHPNYLIHSS